MRRTRGSSPRWGVATSTLCQSFTMSDGQAEVLDSRSAGKTSPSIENRTDGRFLGKALRWTQRCLMKGDSDGYGH
jgi:hypothetical protein